jgi:hypothetical protein
VSRASSLEDSVERGRQEYAAIENQFTDYEGPDFFYSVVKNFEGDRCHGSHLIAVLEAALRADFCRRYSKEVIAAARKLFITDREKELADFLKEHKSTIDEIRRLGSEAEAEISAANEREYQAQLAREKSDRDDIAERNRLDGERLSGQANPLIS